MAMVAAGLGITTAPVSLAIAGTVPIDVAGYAFARTVGLLCDAGFAQALAAHDLLASINDKLDACMGPSSGVRKDHAA
jgi:hypothetical protein